MRASTWAPLATFAVIAAAGVGVAVVQHGGGTGSGPPPLRLATGSVAASPLGAPAGGDYRLAVTLSDAQPPDQWAATLSTGPADAGVVAALARALHAGSPVRSGKGWRAGLLAVSDTAGQAWTWNPCGGDPAAGVSASCAVLVAPGAISGGGTTTPSGVPSPPPAVPRSVVEDAARGILQAVGLDVGSAVIETSPYGGSATVDQPGTVGLTTRVDVDVRGRITSATGWLGTQKRSGRYPVVSAKEAFGRLPRLMHPDICRVAPGGKGGCLAPEPVVVTGAALGLSLQPTVGGGSVLVPSWLFATRAGGTLAAVAVSQRYLPTTAKVPVRDRSGVGTTKAPPLPGATP